VARYRRRISGPLLDRFDLTVPVRRLHADELQGPPGEPSAHVAARVAAARAIQARRGSLNRSLGRAELDDLPMHGPATTILARAVDSAGLTARGFDRIRRVARTLADLESVEVVGEEHVAEALALRGSW
jgi:magnesium chelatase family protein